MKVFQRVSSQPKVKRAALPEQHDLGKSVCLHPHLLQRSSPSGEVIKTDIHIAWQASQPSAPLAFLLCQCPPGHRKVCGEWETMEGVRVGTEEIPFIAGVLHLNCKLSFGRKADSQTVCGQTDAAWEMECVTWQQRHTQARTCVNTHACACTHAQRTPCPFFLPRRERTPPIVAPCYHTWFGGQLCLRPPEWRQLRAGIRLHSPE